MAEIDDENNQEAEERREAASAAVDSADSEAIEAEIVDAPEDVAAADSAEVPVEVEGTEAADAAASEDDAVDGEVVEGSSSEKETPARPSVKGRRVASHKAAGKADDGEPDSAPKPKHVARVVGIVVAVLLVLALIAVGLFSWQKWFRYDDSADIQGVWKVQSTGETIVFDGRDLKLTKGISYEYKLDTDAKTITYTFGELAGGGHYYFDVDHDTLIIIDGDATLGLPAEAGFLPDDLVNSTDAAENTTVLVKVSDDTNAEPSGTATGVSGGSGTTERVYVSQEEVEEESSSSSSSSKKKSSDDEDSENRGFVDEDGDGYDDETGLEYEDFMAEREDAADDEADEEDADYDIEYDYDEDADLADE